ncbi:hypothetical protein [Marinilabilia rubra]|uniref:Uncharacterized protein n=1 Tax=Marinilabilia rubra TaxID=2162893 RepID=A0A2U2B5A2_9BACT|nr:hypothetical protein [Marinilabilia rubra]PWD98261.1 hypothetical protein DDZ16_16650 [Marinilabilia rubra]
MNERQNQHFRMFDNSSDVLDDYTEAWSPIPIMAPVKNQLDELRQRIQETDNTSQLSSSRITEKKNKLLSNLAKKVAILSGILKAFYALEGEETSTDKYDVSKTDLIKARERDVEAIVTPLIKKVRDNIEALSDFGVTEAMVSETETTLDDFTTLIGKPRTIRNKRFTKLKTLDELFDATNDLLKNTLDPLMLQFELSNPEFYEEYTRARTIVD